MNQETQDLAAARAKFEEMTGGKVYTEAEVRDLLNKGDVEMQLRVKAMDMAIASRKMDEGVDVDDLKTRANTIYEFYKNGVIAV